MSRFLAKTFIPAPQTLDSHTALRPNTTGELSVCHAGTFFPVISGEVPALFSSVQPVGQRKSVIENQNNWIHEMEFNFGLFVC